jgi:hypothetical protein
MIQQNKENKKMLGKFYTTNYDYILQNLHLPDNITNIIEPFAGNGDLLNFIKNKEAYNITCYDIEPQQDFITQQDTFIDVPDFTNQFVITNPPYLARNKSTEKKYFDKYNTNDLYKCFIKILIEQTCIGGILIVPLNFISSIRKNDVQLRDKFLEKYNIQTINIFEEQVFKDTKYSVCCFQFSLKSSDTDNHISCNIYPSNKHFKIILNKHNNYSIGGEIYNLQQNEIYKIERATHLLKDKKYFTNILVKCIDDNIHSKIGMSIVDNIDTYIDTTKNLSARSYAILVIEPAIDLDTQKKLVDNFNSFLNNQRETYHSLFLTNFRESNSIARKRISFGLVYTICKFLLYDIYKNTQILTKHNNDQ